MRLLVLLGCVFAVQMGFSQESNAWQSLCPASVNFSDDTVITDANKVKYENPLTENYHCIKDWDPCDASWWSSHSNITSVDGPFRKSAFTFPALLSDEGNYWDHVVQLRVASLVLQQFWSSSPKPA